MTVHECLQVLSRFAAALLDEAQAQRREGGQSIHVTDGRRLASDDEGAIYRFDIHAEVFLPDGVSVELVAARRRYPAEVLHREGDQLYLFVSPEAAALASEIEEAELLAQPWFLHEQLASRLTELMEQVGAGARDLGVAELLLDRIVEADREGDLGGTAANRGPFTPGPPAMLPGGSAAARPSEQDPDPYQQAAIRNCASEPLWFVWGPPGTGKTATLGHLVVRLANEPGSVLVTGHANVAIDAAVLAAWQVADANVRDGLVRVGPAVLPEVRNLHVSSRDRALRRRSDLATRLREVQEELTRLEGGKDGAARGRSKELVEELQKIRAEIREEEQSVIREGHLVAATLSKTAITPELYARTFDTAIVDEASMAYPAQVAMAAALASDRLAIFGDFRQLSPIVISEDPGTRALLGRDVFDLAGVVSAVDSGSHVPDLSMLRLQYRMHPGLRELVSDFAYAGLLEDGTGVAERTAPLAMRTPRSGDAAVVVETSSFGARNWRDSNGNSRWNPISAIWALKIAAEIAESECTVAVLTPYRAQAFLLGAIVRGLGYRDRITVGTVHRFQGAERDAVVLDLVAGPPLPVPGVLLEGPVGDRLVTVAASRAKGKLVALISPELFSCPGPVQRLFGGLPPERLELGQWEVRAGGATITWYSAQGLREAGRQQLEEDLAGRTPSLWVADDAPLVLRGAATRAQAPNKAPSDQALVLVQSVVWLFARLIGGEWVGARISDPRTARACRSNLGDPVAPLGVSDAPESIPELPQCRCGSPMTLELAEDLGWGDRAAVVICPACGTTRPASPDDLTRWARLMNLKCPGCGGHLRGRSGPWGLFLGCSRYPHCKGRRRLESVL